MEKSEEEVDDEDFLESLRGDAFSTVRGVSGVIKTKAAKVPFLKVIRCALKYQRKAIRKLHKHQVRLCNSKQ